MSKAVLVIDSMPTKCCQCPAVDFGCYMCQCGMMIDLTRENMFKKKPDWCPLRPLPEKQDTSRDYSWDEWSEGWDFGYNQAIDDVLGVHEDEEEVGEEIEDE